MSTGPFTVNLSEARRYWGWFVGLGVLLIILGLVAIEEPIRATLASVMILGILLCVSGLGEIITSLGTRTWGGILFHLLFGIIDIALGGILFSEPLRGSVWLTYVLGLFFLFGGALQIAFAASTRYPNWGWGMVSGAITVLLGGLVLTRWPDDSFFLIGLFVGIELLLRGWTWIMVGAALSSVPGPSKTA